MRVLVLLSDADPEAWERATEAEREAVLARHDDFDRAVRERGSVLSGEALADGGEARTLRTVDGRRVVTEGPYAESVEQLGGFYLLEVDSVATAVELCRLLPESYTVEVRPAVDIERDDSERSDPAG